PSVPPLENVLIKEGQLVVEAGSEQYEIDRRLRTVLEEDSARVEFRDVGLGDEIAMRQMMQHLRVHDWMAGQRIMVWLRKPEPGPGAGQAVEHHGRIERDRHAARRVGDAIDEDVRRHAKNVLRHEAI